MEFFHAEIFWSGYSEVIANVIELPSAGSGELTWLNGGYAILRIFLKDSETLKLRQYLESEFGKTIPADEFEQYMKAAFYCEIPLLDSWFNLEKFMKIQSQLQIDPIMYFYRYRLIRSGGSR